jgi:hypothetical protein
VVEYIQAMRIMARHEAHRLLRLRDFATRSAGHPGGVYAHAASGTLPIHPFADEADLLVRLGVSPDDCRGVDAYWEVNGDVCVVEVWSAADRLGLFYRWSVGKLPILHLAARVADPFVTRPSFERIMSQFIAAGVPADPPFRREENDGLVRLEA